MSFPCSIKAIVLAKLLNNEAPFFKKRTARLNYILARWAAFFFYKHQTNSSGNAETIAACLTSNTQTLCDRFISVFFPTLCAVTPAAGGLFCCIKHFVGGQLYIMRGKSALLWRWKKNLAHNFVYRVKLKSWNKNIFFNTLRQNLNWCQSVGRLIF